MMTNDEKYMLRCLQLARLGEYEVAPNPMVGAVLVSADGQVLAEGWHKRFGGPHAEVNCFRDAEERGVSPEAIREATLYVSLEPCSHYGKTPPCALLVAEKHPRRLVCGMFDPNPQVSGRGVAIVREAGIDVTVGVLEHDCRELNKRFLMLHEHQRPYITLKWAQTADGFLDNRLEPTGRPLVISTPFTKQLVHKMRAENMAILVGSGTALMDNPRLHTTRWEGRNPVRVLLDSRGRVPKDSLLLQDADEPSDYAGLPRTIVIKDASHNPTFVCDMLAAHGIHSVLIEGGAEVLRSFLEAKLYDEVHIEVNPHLVAGSGIKAPDSPEGTIRQEETVDGNTMITLLPHR